MHVILAADRHQQKRERAAGPCRAGRCLFVAGLALAMVFAVSPAPADEIRLVSGLRGAFNVPVTSYKTRPFKTIVRQRFDFSCGSAAVATLLTFHFERPTSEREAFDAMFAVGDQQKIRREGFSLYEMKLYLESIGFEADGYRVPLALVARVGVPVITLINTGGYKHFVVIKGLRPDRVLVGDPALGLRVMPVEEFMTIWEGGIIFAIHSADEIGGRHFNDEAEWSVLPRFPIGDARGAAGIDAMSVILPGANDIF